MEKRDRQKTDLPTLLKMRRATKSYHEYARPSDRADISQVRMPVRQLDLDFREGFRRLSLSAICPAPSRDAYFQHSELIEGGVPVVNSIVLAVD